MMLDALGYLPITLGSLVVFWALLFSLTKLFIGKRTSWIKLAVLTFPVAGFLFLSFGTYETYLERNFGDFCFGGFRNSFEFACCACT